MIRLIYIYLKRNQIEVICDMCNKIGPFKTDWYWKNIIDYHIVCWKPLPEIPKE